MTDFDLLREYASRSSDKAFASLVDRHAGLVYSAALRQTRDPHWAKEITQVVFIILARKAAGMGKNVILPGWLLRTTRFVALNAIRRELHRRHTEQQAVSLLETETDTAWKQMAPILDEALFSLGEKDRNAVALRFLDQKTFKEIAQLLGTSEDGAQKRVTRALEKLRANFVRNGVALSTTAVAATLTARAVQAAPAGLPASIVAGALSSATLPPLASTAMAALQRASVKALAWKLSGSSVLLILALLALREFTAGRVAPPLPPNLAQTPVVAAGPPPSTLPPDSVSPLNPGQILLRVLDSETDAPVRNAKLMVIGDTGFPNIVTNLLTTDRQGESLLSFPPTSGELWNRRIEIIKDGYVPKFVSWAAARGDMLDQIPAQYTTRLDPGTVVAGMVLNENGEPIPDVQVGVGGPGPGTGPEPPAEREGLAVSHLEATDSQGRWFCNHLPSQLQLVSFTLSHPDYLPATFRAAKVGGAAPSGPSLVLEQDLRNGATVMVLKRGSIATGIVTDEGGQSIAGASVTRDRLYWDPAATTPTAADGRFRFGNIPGGQQLILTAQADGFLPADITLAQGAHSETIRLVLPKAAIARGRVLDVNGNPISQASVLPTSGDYGSDRFHWGALTDAQGRFEWRSAPAAPLQYQITAPGYKSIRVDLPSDGAEHTITLKEAPRLPPVRIAGRVIDSHSGQPVAGFQVWTAMTLRHESPSGFPTYSVLGRKLTTTGENGRFAFLAPTHYAEPIEKVDIEVRAQGYAPAQNTLSGPLAAPSEINLKLDPVGGLNGTVQLPDGAPAANALVVACGSNDGLSQPDHAQQRVYITLPGEFDLRLSSPNRSETDAAGAFTLKSRPPAGTLFVAHKAGYAEVPLGRLPSTPVIKLNPWGAVSGTLRIAKALGTNRTVLLSHRLGPEPQFVFLTLTASTDDSGHFKIAGVPPGQWRLWPHATSIIVKAGETTEVVVGGGGLCVVGRTNPEDAIRRLNEEGYHLTLSSRLFGQAPPDPQRFSSVNDYLTAKTTWFRGKLAYLQTEAGREALRDSRDYTLVTQPDGKFFVDEVLPGTYELSLRLNPSRLGLATPLLEEVIQEVVVPEPAEVSSGTLDLGAVDVHLAEIKGLRR